MPVYKPSITYWNRLEPRPRSPSIRRSLAAQVRDPLWLLGRQWQVGEFQGEDAGSPAFAEVADTRSSMLAWRARGGTAQVLKDGGPLEAAVGAEPCTPDLVMRVELGQILERLLYQAGGVDLVEDVRAAYLLQPVEENKLAGMKDQNAARFLRVCGGRVADGVAVYLEARNLLASVQDTTLRKALARFIEWVEELYGPLSDTPAASPAAWQPERLEYDAEVTVTLPDGSPGLLGIQPTSEDGFGWHGFDQRHDGAMITGTPVGTTKSSRWSMLPANVRFRGMPKPRWWEFEDGTTDFGEIKPDQRDLARLVLMDFMLVHSNDWFVLPVEMAVGSLCRIDSLLVQDVFGSLTRIERADASPAEGWTMFSTSVEGHTDTLAGFFLLPFTAAAALQTGPTIEEVQFLRDEMANMVWAVEHITEDGTGQPWLGQERALAGRGALKSAITNPQERPGLSYRIQTDIPEHWVPFIPVLIDAGQGDIALERAALVQHMPGADHQEERLPLARILKPAMHPYRIREQEVPRSGLRVLRTVCRTRWMDGSTYVWVSRKRVVGRGEGRSGLSFDRAEPSTGQE